MKKLLQSALMSLALMTSHIVAVQADDNVKNAMTSLKQELGKLGEPRLEGKDLYFGSSKINGDYTVVDAIKAKHGGTATVFVKDGNNYIRISTNVMKSDKRAVGTPLDPSGPAKAAIDQKQPFYGPVDILGKIYQTGYEPVTDAAGNTIGIYYVGYSLE